MKHDTAQWRQHRQKTKERHLACFLNYGEKYASPTTTAYDALAKEVPNLRKILLQAYELQLWQPVQRFALALCRPMDGFLSVRGHWDMLQIGLDQAVKAARNEGDKLEVARFLHNLAMARENLGDWQEAQSLYNESLAISESIQDDAGIGRSLHQLGILANRVGDYQRAKELYERGLIIAEKLDDKADIAIMQIFFCKSMQLRSCI